MSKFTDSIKAALTKKQAAQHPDSKNTEPGTPAKPKATMPVANKPQKKVTGRGR